MRAYVLRGVSMDSRYAAPSGRDGEAGDEAVSA